MKAKILASQIRAELFSPEMHAAIHNALSKSCRVEKIAPGEQQKTHTGGIRDGIPLKAGREKKTRQSNDMNRYLYVKSFTPSSS